MRSSVVESYPPVDVKTRGSYVPPSEPRMPNLKRPPSQPIPRKPKRRVVLAPADGWLALVLLAVAVYSVVYSIMAANWVDHTTILIWSTASGLIIGLIIAKIHRIPQAVLHLAACLVGHWLSVWLTSALAFQISWLVVLGSLRSAFTSGFANPMTATSEMVFLFYLSFLCFFLGYFGTWLIYRARLPWLVAFVYCSILLVNLNYVKQDLTVVVAILLVALMLLIVRIQLANQLIQWTNEGLHTDRDWTRNITARFMCFASPFAVCILLISWILPILGQPATGIMLWDNLNNVVTNISHGHISLQDPGSIVLPYQPPTQFFSDQLTIAGTVNLPSGNVLYYTSTAAPQYLEGFTYDHFDGHTWTSLLSSNGQNYDAHAQLPADAVGTGFPEIATIVTVVQPPENAKHYIFAPAQPARFDVPTTIYGNNTTSAWTQQSPLTAGERYQVISNLPTAMPKALEMIPLPSDNTDYWKTDGRYSTLESYYLSVPVDLSPNVLKIAQQWAAGATNTYDALKRLEARLSDQTQFTYSLSNPNIPRNVDVVDWLLQTRRGYCTYYASAMSIMARLLGIPTRMVNGFSHGHFDVQHNLWVVNGTDAHSWVQAYFPGYGWLNFDPTPGYATNVSPQPQPTINLVPTQTTPKSIVTATVSHTKPVPYPTQHPGSGVDPTIDTNSPGSSGPQNLLVGLSIASLVGSLLFFVFAVWTYWWRSLYANSTFVSGMFWRLCRVASWVGLSPQEWQTPYEYSSILSQQSPKEADSLWRLTDLFVRDRWAAPHETPYVEEEDDLERLWSGLRRLLLHILLRKIKNYK